MSRSKDVYVPSPFTLTLLDNFGTRRLLHRPQPTAHTSQHHRSEARLRPAFDKEALLDQLRQEKARGKRVNASSGYLKRQLSHVKHPLPASVAPAAALTASLKRELEAVAAQVEAQAAEITRLKTSKKYNRYVELLTARQVYEEQLAAARARIARNAHALRDRRRQWHEHRARENDAQAIDRAVGERLRNEQAALAQRLEEEEERIRSNLQRQAAQLRERDRLVRDILALQHQTGKIYILQNDQHHPENTQIAEEALQPPPRLQTDARNRKAEEDAEEEEEEEEEEYEQEEQSSSCSSGEERQPAQQSSPRGRNLSF